MKGSRETGQKMSKGIVIFGPAGAGKTTLGMMAASALDYPYFDFDDYIWRKDTEEPFTVRYSEEEKMKRILKAIRQNDRFVLSGYMDGEHEALDAMFAAAFHLSAPAELRIDRIRRRDRDIYGDRVLPGGDMYDNHERFIESVRGYGKEDDPFEKRHWDWAESLNCPVIRLEGDKPLVKNLKIILKTCRELEL